jgi:hypothetical protein
MSVGTSVAILIIVLVLTIIFFYKDPFGIFIKGRQKDIYECGYASQTRGWYDFRNQGKKNDYCSFVGDNPPFFACQFGDPAKLTTRYGDKYFDPTAPHDPVDTSLYSCKWPAVKA